MMRTLFHRAATASLLGTSLLLGACDPGSGNVIQLPEVGTVGGLVYLDANRNGQPDASDPRLGGVQVRLLAGGTRPTSITAVTGGDGTFIMRDVPIGDYRATIASGVLGDTLAVLPQASREVVVLAATGQQAEVVLAVSFPLVTPAEARRLPAGRKVFVAGVAVTGPNTFDDATVHVSGDSAALRMTRVRPGVSPGDSARFLGRIGTDAGQPVLDDVVTTVLGRTLLPVPIAVTTQQAGSAGGGSLDAEYVQVTGATIQNATSVAEDFLLVLNDGSGPVSALLDRSVNFNRTAYTVGTVINARGVLVPISGSPAWLLKPTRSGDLTIVAAAPPPSG